MTEHLAEVGEISGVLSRIVGVKVGAGGGELTMAGFSRRQMGALGCLGIKAKAEKRSGEVVGGRAGKCRLREHGAALAHYQNVAVANEIGSDECVDLQGGYIAWSTGQIDNWIGSLIRGAGREFRDHEPDGAAIRSTTIFKHDEIAATRVDERLGTLQFRARRRL